MNETTRKIRVRFAPSPTGYLHIGSLRTVLYDYLFARHNGGDFLLRIEDTDRSRYVEGAVENLISTLGWAGLDWDEGIFHEKPSAENGKTVKESATYPGNFEIGNHGPYVQSEKLETYKKYAEELVEKGLAYYCFCSPERLEGLRATQTAAKQAPMYDRHCLNLSQDEIRERLAKGEPHVIRLKMPKGETIEFDDIVRGRVRFNTDTTDDQVILKSDGFPTYHLAVVVDDHEMGITHVLRGEEWLSSTPKHILLYRFFGWDVPEFAHLSLLLNPDKSKLSKRQGDVAVEDYIKKGYLKEALVNFVALLGWNPGEGETQELFSLDELAKRFELSKVHKAGAVFDIRKLDWMNGQYIKRLSIEELYEKCQPFFKDKDFYLAASPEKQEAEYARKALKIEQERMLKLSNALNESRFLFDDIDYPKEMLKWKEATDEQTAEALRKSEAVLNGIEEGDWTVDNLGKVLMEAAGTDRGGLLWPLRVALTGERKSPSPFEVAWALGKKEALERIAKALEK